MDEKLQEESDAAMENAWRTRGGGIWNHSRQPSTTRVKCRATTCQLVQLVKFMEKHKELAVSHTQPFPGSEQLWEELAEHINQFGPPKNPKQCKTTWRDLRKRAFAMMRSRNKDKQKTVGRNLYGMAPKIVSLIASAGGLPKTGAQRITPASEAGSSKASSEVPATTPGNPGVIKVEKTSSGDKLIIRVTDKQNSKSNVFNSFSVSDGHFENNIIVKEEERDDPLAEEEETEFLEEEQEEEQNEERRDSTSEVLFPTAQALLGNQEDGDTGDMSKVWKELNRTLAKFVSEYSERTVLLRERLDLDRARLQFDMEVFHRSKKDNDS